MAKRNQEAKRRCFLLPCPSYDVAGMEEWLAGKAREGWLLEKDGVFAGTASFVRSEPCEARYRLEAVQKEASLWADNGGEPDPEAVELGERFAWEYVAKRGNFYICRTLDPHARELNTDPAVQALAVSTVQKRQISGVFTACFWLFVYAAALIRRGGVLLMMVETGTVYFVATTALMLWLLAGSLAEAAAMGRLKRRLRAGLPVETSGAPHPGAYWAKKAALAVYIAVWACVSLYRWGLSAMDMDKTPLTEYHQPLPFAAMADLAGGDAVNYRATMQEFNYVKTWSDPLAPENIAWAEHAAVTRKDGTALEGGLYIDYHRAQSEWIARCLALGYVRHDRQGRSWEPLPPPEIEADFVAAYYGELHWPVVVVQQGDTVWRAMLYETGQGQHMAVEEWAGVLAQSVLQKDEEGTA